MNKIFKRILPVLFVFVLTCFEVIFAIKIEDAKKIIDEFKIFPVSSQRVYKIKKSDKDNMEFTAYLVVRSDGSKLLIPSQSNNIISESKLNKIKSRHVLECILKYLDNEPTYFEYIPQKIKSSIFQPEGQKVFKEYLFKSFVDTEDGRKMIEGMYEEEFKEYLSVILVTCSFFVSFL